MSFLRTICFGMILGWVCSSCTQKEADVLPMAKMEQILYDINLAEAYSTVARHEQNLGGVKDLDTLSTFYKAIFEHHKITLQQYEQSMQWYKTHPVQLDSLYSHVSAMANDHQTNFMKTQAATQH